VIQAAPWFRKDAFDPRGSTQPPGDRDAGTFEIDPALRRHHLEPSNLDRRRGIFPRSSTGGGLRLKPGGIFCQWLQCYETSEESLATIFRTLATRFPGGHVFFFRVSHDLVIVTSPEGALPLDVETMIRALRQPEPARDLARVGIASAPDLLRYYRGSLEGIVARQRRGPINTDDNGWLEHRAPLDLMRMTKAGDVLVWNEDVASDLATALAKDPDGGAKILLEALDAAILADDGPAARGFWMTLRKMGRPETAQAGGSQLSQQGIVSVRPPSC
jgi:hypothetical protein